MDGWMDGWMDDVELAMGMCVCVSDLKPETWVDEETIADPSASKPDDWDESQPPTIPDPDAVKVALMRLSSLPLYCVRDGRL